MSEAMGTEDRHFLWIPLTRPSKKWGRLISWLKCRKTATGWRRFFAVFSRYPQTVKRSISLSVLLKQRGPNLIYLTPPSPGMMMLKTAVLPARTLA